jgi:hypothetical protein
LKVYIVLGFLFGSGGIYLFCVGWCFCDIGGVVLFFLVDWWVVGVFGDFLGFLHGYCYWFFSGV